MLDVKSVILNAIVARANEYERDGYGEVAQLIRQEGRILATRWDVRVTVIPGLDRE